MGIFMGIVAILIGLWEWWSAHRVNGLFGWQSTKHYPRVFGYIGCGLLTIGVCVLTHGQDAVLDGLTFLASMGGLLLASVIWEIYCVRSCQTAIKGVFAHFSPALGMMPSFTYQIGGKWYKETSLPCRMESYRASLQEGETYTIFINEAKPERFVFVQRLDWGNIILAIFVSLICIGPWLVYLWRLLAH